MDHRQYTMLAFDKFMKETNFPKDAKVLDVGCRNNVLQPELEAHGFEWHGCDTQPGRHVTQAYMEDMNIYEDNSFDLVFVCHAFEHCERPIDALREFNRILKPGGWLFMSMPNPVLHHVLGADHDHIMCLHPMQLQRMMIYTEWKEGNCYLQEHDGREQNYNVITIGKKND